VLSEHDIQIAPGTHYAHRGRQRVSQADWDDALPADRLVDLWRANRSLYGAEKLGAAARWAGIDIGRDQVARLMGIGGICELVGGPRRVGRSDEWFAHGMLAYHEADYGEAAR
jgi:putative transposase